MIHWVVALRPEAEPFIEALDLRPRCGEETQRGEENRCGEETPEIFEGSGHRLAVSGVGRRAAAAAVEALDRLAGGQRAVWVNVGLAGHRSRSIGEAVVADRILEHATGRRWFPQLVIEPDLPTGTVCTVDRAVESPGDDRLYEMEASGFFAAAMRASSAELTACVKVVSDHGVGPGNWPRAQSISRLMGGCLEPAIALAGSLEALAREGGPPPDEVDLTEVLDRWHFTATQYHQLRALSRRGTALGASVIDLAATAEGRIGRGDRQATRDLLRALEAALDDLALRTQPPGSDLGGVSISPRDVAGSTRSGDR